MAVIINASTSTGLVQSADTSGQINLQSNGTTVLGVTSTGTSVTGTQSVSGNLSFNSGYGSSAVSYGCRAWVNFDGTGTPAIRASGNVSTIGDLGTGSYQFNFTNAMPDANYSISGSDVGSNQSLYYSYVASQGDASTTTYFRFVNIHQNGTLNDQNYLMLQVFR
jgi:hypothetical protein